MSSPPTTPSPSRSATTSPTTSPRRGLVSDDEKLAATSAAKPDLPSRTPSPPPPAAKTPVFPSREDCWSEEATRTLIEAWGAQYLNLNRGNLRQKHWQEVADAVNAAHAAKLRRSDVQCKNRIDTTKKKYKIEKSKVVDSNGRYVSAWPHFDSLDALIGDFFSKTPTSAVAVNGHSKNLRRRVSPPTEISPSPPLSPARFTGHRSRSPPIHRRGQDPASARLPRLPWSVPVGPRSKRSGTTSSVAERNFSVMAAAAAAMEAEEDEDDDYDGEGFRSRVRRLPAAAAGKSKKRRAAGLREGYRMVAEAIMRFGEIYEKVEMEKQRQMAECERQRMQFAQDLEMFRAQLQLDNLKFTSKNSSSYL